jgi:hypothetical protein
MEKKTPVRKLMLRKETIRSLTSTDLGKVVGGISANLCNLSFLCNAPTSKIGCNGTNDLFETCGGF